MKRKSILLIVLFLIFLFSTQILQGQNSSKIIQNIGKNINVPIGLMDTIIHDLQERKQLIRKDSLSKAYILILSDEVEANHSKIWETEKSLLISEKKRIRNGWHRNTLLLMILIFGAICTR